MIRNIKITIDRDTELDVCTLISTIEHRDNPAYSLRISPLFAAVVHFVAAREGITEVDADLIAAIDKALTGQHTDATVNGVAYAFNLSAQTESGEWLPWIIDPVVWGRLTLRNYIDQMVYWLDRGGHVKVLLEPTESMVDKVLEEVFHRCSRANKSRARKILTHHITELDSLHIAESLVFNGYSCQVYAAQDANVTIKELRWLIVG